MPPTFTPYKFLEVYMYVSQERYTFMLGQQLREKMKICPLQF